MRMNGTIKIIFKVFFFIILTLLIIVASFFVYYLLVTKNSKLDESKLVNLERIVNFYDIDGNIISEQAGGVSVTPINNIPENVLKAFIAIEDKRFYSHNGIDGRRLIAATLKNIKSFSFKEGASTISQQLIKNTHLSSKKTISRKLSEIKLAKELEKQFSKNEILEKYLNTIYFGEGCYGITAASRFYFNKSPKDLSLNEGAALAAVIKAPSLYSPVHKNVECNNRKNIVLRKMKDNNFISDEEYNANINKEVISNSSYDKNTAYINLVKCEIGNFLDQNAYTAKKIKVYTNFDKKAQEILEKNIGNKVQTDKSAVFMDNKNRIKAYYSTCGNILRQVGSALKPLAVFAPAIEYNVVSAETPILDQKTNFNGYAPSNYNDKYYGYVTVRDSLAKSLNVPAVKILNDTGLEKVRNILKKLQLNVTDKDNSLTLALGCTNSGISLTNLTAAYGIFYNYGKYFYPRTVNKITSDEKTIWAAEEDGKKIIGEDTAYIVSDMMRTAVTDGTAKKLNYLNFPVCAKTGTVGGKSGNSDAYSISYNGKYSLGIWYGNKDNSIMDNSVTGGTYPTKAAYKFWKELAPDYKTLEMPNDVCIEKIDKISFNDDHILVKAEENAPNIYVKKAIFKKDNLPSTRSNRFSNPKLESFNLLVNKSEITIQLCLAEYYGVSIIKQSNNGSTVIFDGKGKSVPINIEDTITDCNSYIYYAIPYFKNNNTVVKGQPVELGKVKISYNDGEWWKDDFE